MIAVRETLAVLEEEMEKLRSQELAGRWLESEKLYSISHSVSRGLSSYFGASWHSLTGGMVHGSQRILIGRMAAAGREMGVETPISRSRRAILYTIGPARYSNLQSYPAKAGYLSVILSTWPLSLSLSLNLSLSPCQSRPGVQLHR
jgi:hypothetical protein